MLELYLRTSYFNGRSLVCTSHRGRLGCPGGSACRELSWHCGFSRRLVHYFLDPRQPRAEGFSWTKSVILGGQNRKPELIYSLIVTVKEERKNWPRKSSSLLRCVKYRMGSMSMVSMSTVVEEVGSSTSADVGPSLETAPDLLYNLGLCIAVSSTREVSRVDLPRTAPGYVSSSCRDILFRHPILAW